MQSKKHTKLAAMRVKTLTLALVSTFLIYSGVHAAGLGKLTMLSSLGQPLRAEIEITSFTENDVDNLFPKLADSSAFLQANVDFNPALYSLRFIVEDRGSRHFVLITSPQPFNEPYVELLVELTSSSGRLVREYAMLLGLIEMKSNNAAANVDAHAEDGVPVRGNSNNISVPGSAPDKSIAAIVSPVKPKTNPASDKSISSAAKQNSSQNSARNSATYYQIKSGDTLGKIAEQFNYPGVSLDQMLVALQRNNSSAIINDNVNLIRSGVILTIPDKSEVERIDQSAAQKIVIAQSVDFNAYREKLANQIAQGESEKMPETKKINSGKITAKVIETPTVINELQDKLKLSKPEVLGQAEVKMPEEDKIAEQKAREVSTARIKELEQNTAKLQKILELQKEAASIPSQPQANNKDVVNPISASTVAPTIQNQLVQPQIVVAAKSTTETNQHFFDNWERFIPYGAILIALLVGLGMYLSKRKKEIKTIDDGSMLIDLDKNTVSLPEDTETESSVLSSELIHSATQTIENEVDPITEADIHIAYGRDSQAEEILKLALYAQPDSQSIRIKLLQIYARRTDIHQFGEIASELHHISGGVGPEWAQAAAMGIILDPQNPLYTDEQHVNADIPPPEFIPDTKLANQDVSPHSESEPCPECEQTGMAISPLNFNVSAPIAKQEKLIQIETNNFTPEVDVQPDASKPASVESTMTTHTPVEFDLSGIDLELPELRSEKVQTKLNIDEVLKTSSTAPPGDVAIKLDLASTYQKIGDKDEARELLDDVIRDGDPEQIARAKAMRQELS